MDLVTVSQAKRVNMPEELRRRNRAPRSPASVGLCLVWALAATGCGRPSADSNPGSRGSSGLASGAGQPVGLVVVGDFGKGNSDEATLATQIRTWTESHPFDAFVTVGDNVYGTESPSFFPKAWNRPFGWVEQSSAAIVASLGNHDVQNDGGAAEMALFGMPGRYYEREVGPVELFVLDANDPKDPAQLAWLQGALAASKAAWKVVVFHQPAYSCGSHGSRPEVQKQWTGLFQRLGVQLVLNGHDHDYQRFAPIGGVTYIVDGGGAARLYPVGSCPSGTPAPVASNDTVHEFLYLSATPQRLSGQALAVDGSVIDTFVLNAAG